MPRTAPKIENSRLRGQTGHELSDDGHEYAIEVMSEPDYREALWEKLVEEAEEARDAARGDLHKIVTELADLQEVVDAIMTAYGIQPEAVLDMQRKRRVERGGFVKRLRLLWTE